MINIEKTVSNEIKKWVPINKEIYYIKIKIVEYYKIINYVNESKDYFNRLHYFKMLKDYIYLKAYYYNIKKTTSNYKLLCYFESILTPIGLDFKSMIFYFYLLKQKNYERYFN